MSKLIFGCGYLGQRVARLWRDAGQQVFVITRNPDRAGHLAQQGFRPIVADVLRSESLEGLPSVESVLLAIGYDRSSGKSIREVYAGGMSCVLESLSAETGKIIYTSSTGVYSQSQDEWVDEDSACEPERDGGKACLDAERILAAHPLGARSVVLRLAGLYGPGRIPYLDQIQRNQPIGVPDQGYLNLIHVDDAADVVVAADAQAPLPRTYIVADGNPASRRDYYEELARLLGAPPPVFAPPPDGSPRALRAASSKRARSVRMLTELGIELRYPTYRQGLAAILASQQSESTERT